MHLQLNFCVPVLLVTPIFYIFNAKAYVDTARELFTLWLLLLLYGCDCTLSKFALLTEKGVCSAAIIPLMYLFTFVFATPPWAFVVLAGVNTMLGVVSTVAVAMLRMFAEELNDDVLRAARDWCERLFLLLPQYNLGGGLMKMALAYIERQFAASVGFDIEGGDTNLYAWDNVGGKLLCLAVQALLFFILVLCVEHRRSLWATVRCCGRQMPKKHADDANGVTAAGDANTDEDVARERRVVDSCNDDDYGLVLRRLTKVYDNGFCAVDSVSAAIERGQCFGLLGVNGAGKTTTFKMLTAKLNITDGDASINGLSVRRSARELYRVVGYCPQFDALNTLLTGREQLAFYARIRGIRDADIERVADWAIKHMHLRPYGLVLFYACLHVLCSHAYCFAADKTTGSYSGGNKRKLSAAIAMLGNPLVILLVS